MCSLRPWTPLGVQGFFYDRFVTHHPRRFALPPPAGEIGGAWSAHIPAVMQFAEKSKLPASLCAG